MFCTQCGKQTPDGGPFCQNCGFDLRSVIPAAAARMPAAPVYAPQVPQEPEAAPPVPEEQPAAYQPLEAADPVPVSEPVPEAPQETYQAAPEYADPAAIPAEPDPVQQIPLPEEPGYPVQAPDAAPVPEAPPKKKKGKLFLLIGLIVSLVLLLGSIGLNVYQYLAGQEQLKQAEDFSSYALDRASKAEKQTKTVEAEVSKLEGELKEARNDLSAKDEQIASLNDQAAELQAQLEEEQNKPIPAPDDSQLFGIVEDYCDSLGEHTASDNFYADVSVIRVRLADGTGTFTINTTYDGGDTFTIASDDESIADADFATESWGDSVEINVEPVAVGSTVLHINSRNNNEEIKIFVIVTD